MTTTKAPILAPIYEASELAEFMHRPDLHRKFHFHTTHDFAQLSQELSDAHNRLAKAIELVSRFLQEHDDCSTKAEIVANVEWLAKEWSELDLEV